MNGRERELHPQTLFLDKMGLLPQINMKKTIRLLFWVILAKLEDGST